MNINFLNLIIQNHFSYFNFFKSSAVILPYDANVTIFLIDIKMILQLFKTKFFISFEKLLYS